MHQLSIRECTQISGGITGVHIVAGMAALAGGYVSLKVMDFLAPVATAASTIGGAVTLGAICTPFAPGVGTVLCGTAGACGGYFLGATVANVGAFFTGAGVAGYAAYAMMIA